MKRKIIVMLVLSLSLSVSACGGRDRKSAETEQETESQENSSSESETSGQTQEGSGETVTLAADGSAVSIQVEIPEGFTEADYSSEASRIFEKFGENDTSVQYVMTLLEEDMDSVEKTMKQEVTYLLSANSDGTEEDMTVENSETGARTWYYFEYQADDLDGYRIWTELPDGGIFVCTTEWLGGGAADDIDDVLKQLSKALAVYEV